MRSTVIEDIAILLSSFFVRFLQTFN